MGDGDVASTRVDASLAQDSRERNPKVPDTGSKKPSLAEFDQPPVVETVLGVEFAPLKGWDVRHFGLFWAQVKSRFPTLETKPPLLRSGFAEGGAINLVLEQFGDPTAGVRCWLIDEDETRLLQIQADRLIHNWRKVKGDEAYPRYNEAVRPRFEAELREFLTFLDSNGIPRPDWRRCEVTYINHLEKGREWETLDDLPRVLPAFRSGALAGPELSLPESVHVRWKHRLDESDWLTFALQSATRSRDQKKLLQYQISAQISLEDDADVPAILDALDRGRYAVVSSFKTSTSPEAHDLWGMRERVR